MNRTDSSDWPCTIARSADLLGDGWNLLVIREACLGVRRFEDFQRSLGIGRNILTTRLNRLVDEGSSPGRSTSSDPVRHEYRLTDKGREVYPILAAMAAWGDRWLTGPEGSPLAAPPHHVRSRHARRRRLQRVQPALRRPPGPRQTRAWLPTPRASPQRATRLSRAADLAPGVRWPRDHAPTSPERSLSSISQAWSMTWKALWRMRKGSVHDLIGFPSPTL